MNLNLDLASDLADRIPALHKGALRAHGRKHVIERQRFISALLSASYERRRPHARVPGADSFDQQTLARGLRATGSATTYKRLLAPFYEFSWENRHYSLAHRLTKAYVLRPEVRASLDDVYRADSVHLLKCADTGRRLNPDELPSSGLPAALGTGLATPPVIGLDPDTLERSSARVETWIADLGDDFPLDPSRASSKTLREALQILRVCGAWQRALGGMANFYDLQSHGRLGPVGFHIINLPARIRHLLLEGTALYDYDMIACHWHMFLALARASGLATPFVEDYVENREAWHRQWATATGHYRPASFKTVATSWLTGGRFSSSAFVSGSREIGSAGMAALCVDTRATALHEEIRRGMKQLIRDHLQVVTDVGGRVAVNAVGARRPLAGDRSDYSSLCSHLLTGFEQFAMREGCRGMTGLVALIYDGFIATAQDTEEWTARVRKASSSKLGFALNPRLRVTRFNGSFSDMVRDEWDF